MKLREIAQQLKLRTIPVAWLQWEDQAQQAYSEMPLVELVDPGMLETRRRQLGTPESIHLALIHHVSELHDHPALSSLFRLCHFVLYRAGINEGLANWPILHDVDAPAADLFYAYLFLAGRDHMRNLHAERGIAEEVTDQTLSDIFIWMEEHHRQHGRWGLSNVAWVGNYVLKTKLIQFGRLQYVFNTFSLPFRGYRHRNSDHVIVLARQGRKFRSDGQFEGENQRLDPAAPWISEFEATADEIRGHVVSPDGSVEPHPRSLRAADWEIVFDQGSPALSVHIPAGRGLSGKACRESIQVAVAAFRKHFPERSFDLVWCYSWLMDAQLKDYLPPESNIVSFLNEFYLVPFPNTSGWQTLERVFGNAKIDLSTVEPHTSLQRAVLDHIRRGGAWRCPGGVIFPDRYAAGSRSYRRSDWDEPCREVVPATQGMRRLL